MTDRAYFQTRARAIDHLGRGQIADCPTAVTELWKNAHDAYATQVSLHIFQGEPSFAAVFDNGCGMTLTDILTRWLTIGTETKATSEVPKADRFGLEERPKLGEKGIGRLSAGFLAPLTLLVTKKSESQFATALVDWRYFENPHLLITDIQIPYEEFPSLETLPSIVNRMINISQGNLTGTNLERKSDKARVKRAWTEYSKHEQANGVHPTTEDRIEEKVDTKHLVNEALCHWPIARGEFDHGTAVFLIDLNRELNIWVDPTVESDDIEAEDTKNALRRSLTGFLEPDCARRRCFSYYVEVHSNKGSKIRLDSSGQVASEYLQTLEHYVRGKVDENGWFDGQVTAFGVDKGHCNFNLNVSGLQNHRGEPRVGPFSFEIATIEQEASNSTHDQSNHEAIVRLQEEAGGMMVYRDCVRVLPYGRPDSDFFELEERRGKHAGREFWAHRRVFGRVSMSREANPNLRDKAGREGLVENQAKRLMKNLVISVLRETARRFFGSASPIREEELARIKASQSKGRESAKAARKIKRKKFLARLRVLSKEVESAESSLKALASQCRTVAKSKDLVTITTTLEEVERLRTEFDQFDLPTLPKGLEDREQQYRDTRDRIAVVQDTARNMESELADKLASMKDSEPAVVVAKFRDQQVKGFSGEVAALSKLFTSNLKKLGELWIDRLLQAPDTIGANTEDFVSQVGDGESVSWALDEIRAEVDRCRHQLVEECRSANRAIELLLSGVDLDSAFTVSDEGEMSANERNQQLNLLAQSGIAVELISHELEELASETEYNLGRLPKSTMQTTPYKRVCTAFASLVDRFRFLAPLSVATYRARKDIRGKEIADYVSEFFSRRFKSADVTFNVTPSFEKLSFSDVPSRIYPVFINLVNNSLYWLKFAKRSRKICFDFKKGLVIVADSGPGVDAEDIDNLFQMFFTKRPQGRGIGLYLCRANLAIARHRIRYATPDDPKVLAGANFIIEFRGVNG